MYAWQDDAQPLRLVEQAVTRDDPDPQALACYGLLARCWDAVPRREDLWLRFGPTVKAFNNAAAQESLIKPVFAIAQGGMGPFVYRMAPPEQL